MDIPNENEIYDLLDNLAENCTCTNLICLHCRAAECIDELLIAAILNYYRNKRHTWRCRR